MDRIGHSQGVKDGGIDCILDRFEYFAKKWVPKLRKPMQRPDRLDKGQIRWFAPHAHAEHSID